MFAAFERLVQPYPEAAPPLPPRGFVPFVWACSHGLRRYIALMTLFTAAIGVFEALLFAMLGRIVDWLGPLQPGRLWTEHGRTLLLLAAVLVGSTLLVALQSLFKQQAMAGNFPMRLRWNFHRMLLQQSMHFYQDEFAGRIATKLMQTALAVRDVWMILADILVFVLIYFVTMVAVVGGFDAWLLLPFGAWVLLYVAALRFFVPRLARTAKAQADARSLMTGRITDAYTNIATVKLFSHAGRESGYARSAMQEFLVTVYAQMRLVSGFEIMNHLLGIALILATAGFTLGLWMQGQVGVGAVAAATAMALRLNGISHWVMWEMANLFEQVGTVQDGISTLSRPQAVLDRADALPLQVKRGDLHFDAVDFRYGAASGPRVVDQLTLQVRAGEKIGLVGRSGSGKSTLINLLLRFYDVEAGRILVDGQDIAGVTQDSLRAQIGMVTQDTSLLHRSVRDNILYGRPDAGEADMVAAAPTGRGARLHPRPVRPGRPQGLRRPRRRARRQAVGRAAPAHRHRPGDAEGRADPAAGRGHQRAGQRGRGRHPGQPVPADAGQDGGGHCPPAVDHCRDGPAGGAGQGPHRRGRRPPQPARSGRAVRAAVGAPKRRLPGRRRPRARHAGGACAGWRRRRRTRAERTAGVSLAAPAVSRT